MSLARVIALHLRKDLRLEWRSKDAANSMLFFALLVVVIFAFAFDPKRRAVVLCGGSKSGTNERRFYRVLIERADRRFTGYLASLGDKDNA